MWCAVDGPGAVQAWAGYIGTAQAVRELRDSGWDVEGYYRSGKVCVGAVLLAGGTRPGRAACGIAEWRLHLRAVATTWHGTFGAQDVCGQHGHERVFVAGAYGQPSALTRTTDHADRPQRLVGKSDRGEGGREWVDVRPESVLQSRERAVHADGSSRPRWRYESLWICRGRPGQL